MSFTLDRRRVLHLLGGSLALPLMSGQAAFAAPTVTVVSGRLGWPHCMPFIATEMKLWEKYGLSVDHRDLGNGSAAAEAMASGSASFGYINVPNAVTLLQVGLPIKILAATTIGGTSVYTFSEAIKSVADLKGKKVAIPRGVTTHALQFEMYVLPQAGLSKADVEIVPLAPTDNLTAMRRGDVDAAVSFDPYVSQAVALGAKVIVPPNKMWDGPAYSAVVAARADFVAKEPETVRKLVQVHCEVIKFINEDPKKAAEIVNKLLRGTEKDLALQLDSMRSLTFTAKIEPAAVARFADAMVKFGLIKSAPDLGPVVDTSFLPKDVM
ncbi:ABC transporter substrate-binding protein [Aquabacter spiritensis]|uniref:NitT/TauT family transport system substrate-binding protein n=1 Tax=Aquabacter spiritensis TaxID=933073 RepID=A0A4R3LMC2_9HYPH|nr:aliphatic sulfonate ABC transporter substrate-binding protein [Aquabacter spiritensis]TCT01510.1 NitT/TauT family transport system substrate-binding protein [Aquabacter spiritensis]